MQAKNRVLVSPLHEQAMEGWLESQHQEEETKRLKRMVRTATSCLDPQERRIVNLHYGVFGKEMSHDEIGLKLGMPTREVDIMFNAALAKARRATDETTSWLKEELRLFSGARTSSVLH